MAEGTVIKRVSMTILPPGMNGHSFSESNTVTPGSSGTPFLYDSGIQTIGTTEETLNVDSDITGDDYDNVFLMNTDDTNFVDIGFSTGTYNIRLANGDIALISPTWPLYLKADTAAIELYYEVAGV